jgi:amidase
VAGGLLTRSALELAELVRSGEVRSRELVEEALARIERLDGGIGAFTLVDAERALAAAERVVPGDPRPFAGVPTALKDLFAPADGLPMTNGSDLFADFAPPWNGNVAHRLLGAGMVVVGRTKSPELGVTPVTEPRRQGPTRNPWDRERTSGGSSGGAGAAVAAGMVPVAHGSDGGGSIRIPAACCGLVGLKPSRGRISRAPELGDSFLSTDGMLTRSVADSAALLDVLAGYEPGDATWAPPPAEPFAVAATRTPERLRIALLTEPPLDAPVDPVCERAAREAAEMLVAFGHEIEVLELPRQEQLLSVFTDEWAVLVSSGVQAGGLVRGRPAAPDDVEPLTWALHERALAIPSSQYQLLHWQIQRVARELVTALAGFDALLTPALAQRPLPVGSLYEGASDPWEPFGRAAAFTPFTAIWNVTGQPAISLPLLHGEDGLPLGVQLVGRPAGDTELLALAAQLEAARPWSERLAPVAAGERAGA